MGTMTDDRYNGYANRETWAFNLHWSNDQGLYNETLAVARDTIDGIMQGDPENTVSDYELGEGAVQHWREAIDNWQDDYGTPLPANLAMMRDEVGSWWRIDYAEIGASVRESLGIEQQ